MPSWARGLGRGWPGGRGQGTEPRKTQRGGNGKPRGSSKRAEDHRPPSPRETEALRTAGKPERAWLTWQMHFPVEKSPVHSLSTWTEQSCLFRLRITVYRTCSQWSSPSLLEMERIEQRCCEGEEEIREGCCSRATELCYWSALPLNTGFSPHSWAFILVSVVYLCLISPSLFLKLFQTHPLS